MKKISLLLALIGFSSGALADGAKTTKVIWHGHAAFEIITPTGKELWIDPWLKNPLNPAGANNANPVASIERADYILITHGHFDHVGDAVELGKKTKAKLVTNFELGSVMVAALGYPKDQASFETLLNVGGEIAIADGEVTVALTPAIHSSGVTKPGSDELLYGGIAAGIVLKIKDGPTIYDTGDTAYFSDMKLIGDRFSPDLALVNIGGHFGMEPDAAAKAVAAVRPKFVVAHHYKTFPVLTQTTESFAKALAKSAPSSKLLALEPGGSVEFSGRNWVKSPASK